MQHTAGISNGGHKAGLQHEQEQKWSAQAAHPADQRHLFLPAGLTAWHQTGGGGLMDSTERVLWQGTDRPLKGRSLGIGTGIYLTTAPSRESRVALAAKHELLPAFEQTGLY